jgi:hypothetical protein
MADPTNVVPAPKKDAKKDPKAPKEEELVRMKAIL